VDKSFAEVLKIALNIPFRLTEGFLSRYYVDPPSVVVCGQPSSALAKKLEQDEKARIAQQVETLGSDGLEWAKLALEMAKAEHDKPVPQDILTSFPVPNVKSISWIPVQSVQERGIGRSHPMAPTSPTELSVHIETDGSALPFFVQYDHVEVLISVFLLDAMRSLTSQVVRLRFGPCIILLGQTSRSITAVSHKSIAILMFICSCRYISTYLSAFFSLPVKRQSGEYLTHEQVINKLDNETVGYGIGMGFLGSVPEMVSLSIKVETAQYDTAVTWLKDLIYGSEFSPDR
jgi:Zn-dependent M16 (insulinase) family peptidase